LKNSPTERPRALRLVIITNIPAPYRVPVYNRIAAEPGIDLMALYAARTEPDRQWDLQPFAHQHAFLKPNMVERAGRYIHNNADVWRALAAFKPDVVLTTGFNPTHLYAWAYTLLHRCHHVAMTDGTVDSEAGLGRLHRLVRRLVFGTSASFVAASQGGGRLLQSYGVSASHIHYSPLCANTAVDWSQTTDGERDIDLLFSGRLVPPKNADFALTLARDVAARLSRSVRLALLGSGPLEAELRAQARTLGDAVDVVFAGQVAQADLPHWFQRARLFVFPSSGDVWGVVANEACLAGVPVLVSPHAGVAGELVRDGLNGRVLALEPRLWADTAVQLLTDPTLHARMASAAQAVVQDYSFENAALGIIDAARQAHAPAAAAPARISPFQPAVR
jgi:glycosyltransferase involved in cell wall biosynthesis